MKKSLLSQSILAALAPATIVASVFGAPPLAAQVQDEVTELDRIEVTGSRIRRSVDFETAQPVLTLTREDIERTGLTSVGDILQKISTNGATLNTTFNNGGNGETRVDLRNLGSNRTLVLVNGRRWVTTIDGAVDLNTIPVAIIERIEVLKDGASAIYGSDAIAGVVNIITRSDYEGAQVSALVGAYDEGDGDTEAYDVTVGARGERAAAVFNVSYVEQEPVFAGDRPIS
ncbi:MAG TPA: TonB-dependent receptor plug domain-containing protein, partial [Xanthomonadaceae bacterium]|nr:TonB-dependent receptor plug domain-containing protein [Xanthomonadaceae bacterium]